MKEVLDRLQHNLDTNTPCSAADIQAVVDFAREERELRESAKSYIVATDYLEDYWEGEQIGEGEYEALIGDGCSETWFDPAGKHKEGWISVEDRLPEDIDKVLVYLDGPYDHGRRVAISYCHEGQWLSIEGGSWPDMPKPTHWQPLPQPPKNE